MYADTYVSIFLSVCEWAIFTQFPFQVDRLILAVRVIAVSIPVTVFLLLFFYQLWLKLATSHKLPSRWISMSISVSVCLTRENLCMCACTFERMVLFAGMHVCIHVQL